MTSGNDMPDNAASGARTEVSPLLSAGAASRSKRGMRLAMRLWLLILVCLLPMAAAYVFTQVDLRRERQAQLGELAMRQAELANGDLASIVEGARQLASAAGQLALVSGVGPICSERMATLRRDLPAYKFIALYDASGRALCASDRSLITADAVHSVWIEELLTAGTFHIGTFTVTQDIDGPFLPMALPSHQSAGTTGSDRIALVVVALDLGWLEHHLEELRFNRSRLLANAGLGVIDRDGNALARLQAPGGTADRKMPAEVQSLINRSTAGIVNTRGYDGRERVVAYIPTTLPPQGIAVIAAFYPPDMSMDIDNATRREIEFALVSTVLALVLALLAARRFIIRPTERLLVAARRWSHGDLLARADIGESRSEFGALAASFNNMAAALHARERDRQHQSDLLEAQVVERTRELSESNNRLQVEIAERERTEVALHQAQKLQAVGQLAGGIAHDFNNLLATVLGNLELIERGIAGIGAADHERLRRQIERATGAVRRGAQLTARLLGFARRQRLAPQPTDLNRMVVEFVAFASSVLGRRVEIVTDLAPNLWPAQVDPSQLEAAILNLCLNARDAMPDGGRITIITSNQEVGSHDRPDDIEPGAYVRLSVIDTGIGMAAEVQRRAFEPFFTTKGPNGSGLGLSQVYGLARQSSGTVRLSSAPARGTEVTVLLRRAVEQAVVPIASLDASLVRRPMPATMVLVVDDDAAVRQVTADMLRELGYQVMEAEGGADALARLSDAALPVDFVVVDYAMPGMNGLQVAAAVRDMNIDVPVVMITGYAEMADPSDSGADPIDGLLRKPFTIRELQGMLIRLRHRTRHASNVVPMRTPNRG